MPANNIRNYITDTANEKQQTGYFKFRVQNQPVSSPRINTPEKRLRDLTSTLPGPGSSIRSHINSNTPQTQTQNGIGTYRQNNELLRSARNNIRSGADLYLKAGPKLLNENSLFARNTNSQGPLNILSNKINSYINRGITQYQGITSGRRNSNNLLPGGSDTFIRTGQGSTTTSTLSARNWSTRTGSTPTFMNVTLIKNAISQYRTSNESPQRNNFLSSAADLYLKTGMKNLQTTTLFQYL